MTRWTGELTNNGFTGLQKSIIHANGMEFWHANSRESYVPERDEMSHVRKLSGPGGSLRGRTRYRPITPFLVRLNIAVIISRTFGSLRYQFVIISKLPCARVLLPTGVRFCVALVIYQSTTRSAYPLEPIGPSLLHFGHDKTLVHRNVFHIDSRPGPRSVQGPRNQAGFSG